MTAKITALIDQHKLGYSLAQDFYCDPDIYRAEMENIFGQHWLYAGHVSEVPKLGNFMLFEFDRESIIITRSGSGDIKAFANVCRHRGSRLCHEAQGTAKLFTCPYHAWSYDLQGRLVSAREMPKDFDRAKNGLHQIHTQVIEGLIFVCLAETPPSLTPLRDSLKDVFGILEISRLTLAAHKSYGIPANWKLAVENYQECYHCAPAHTEFAKVHAMAKSSAAFRQAKADFTANHKPGGLMAEYDAYFDLAPRGAEGFQYDRNPLLEGMKTGSRDGGQLAPLLGTLSGYSGGASELMIGPLMYFLIYDDHMVGYRFLPVSPSETVCDVYWYVRGDARLGIDYDVDKLTWLWDVTTQADKDIITGNQKGVNSRFYMPGRLSEMEGFLQSFLRWYLSKL